MTRIPGSRGALFALLALSAFAWDLSTKHVVFRDLGYPGPSPRRMFPDREGTHELFAHPPGVTGQSVQYLDGWLSFELYTSFNEGALWGLGQGWTWLFAALSVAAVLGVMYWLFVRKAAVSLWLTVSLACITGGALGNLYDRLGMHGCVDVLRDGAVRYAVRDFLLFTFGGWHWPVFNFADVFLVTGAIMLVLQSFLWPEHHQHAEEARQAADSRLLEDPEPARKEA